MGVNMAISLEIHKLLKLLKTRFLKALIPVIALRASVLIAILKNDEVLF